MGSMNRRTGHRHAKYKAIASRLSKRIADGKIADSADMPSTRELASVYKVSTHTIVKALHLLKNRGIVQVRARSRVLLCRDVSIQSIFSTAIALVSTANLFDFRGRNYYNEMIQTILRSLGDSRVILQGVRWTQEFPAGLAAMPVRGIVLVGQFAPQLLNRYGELGRPVVLLDESAQHSKIHSVSIAGYEASIEAVKHLAALGHRRIAFVRPFHGRRLVEGIDPDAAERTEGFLEGCRQAGIREDHYGVFTHSQEQCSVATGVCAVRPRFTAVICSGHSHAWRFLKEPDLRVPRDLSVVSFGDHTHTDNISGPRIDFREMALRGLALLDAPVSPPQRVRLACTWHEGQTTSAPR